MAIKIRNKRSAEFSMASIADLVFLLLIFFMLTSTLVSPSAIKLLLPTSSKERMLPPKHSINVYIDAKFNYHLEAKNLKVTLVKEEELKEKLWSLMTGQSEGTIILRSDASVPIQYIVNVIDIVNSFNKQHNTLYKAILATQPKKNF